ncbi:MAG TPA: cupin domain-containing protein [Acidimicrobiales bacterium]|nr:cupin domain-containing protein [Acidimicrobiales bacterium]
MPGLRHIPAADLSDETTQTPGMRRREAIAGKTVGSNGVWMGETRMAPATRSADHHHGATETAIYVVSGHPRFVFLVDGQETAIEPEPGDYVFVPPWAPHREENPSPDTEAVVVIARSSQEAVVVNLPSLDASLDAPSS